MLSFAAVRGFIHEAAEHRDDKRKSHTCLPEVTAWGVYGMSWRLKLGERGERGESGER